MLSWDRFFGEEWLESSHELLSDVLIAVVLVHVAGVALESLRHRENLVAAMIHGKKRALDAP
jgi:cytochrome b